MKLDLEAATIDIHVVSFHVNIQMKDCEEATEISVTAEQARMLAAVLVACAEEIERKRV